MTSSKNWTSENLQAITDVMPALISFFDADHVCRFANDYHRYWYGRAPDELVGLHMRDFLGDQGYALRLPYLERVERGEEVAFDALVPHLDGTARDASIRYIPRVTEGLYDGFYTLVFDTAILQHRFHSVFDGTALAFWELDLSKAIALRVHDRPLREVIGATRLIDLNAKAASLFGMNRGAVLGASIGDYWPAASEAVFEAALAAFESHAASFETEVSLRKSDGALLDVLVNCAFPHAKGVRETMVLGIVDLTERNAREAALSELQHELAHAARVAMLGELTASIAHEVNQPLGAVVNNGNAALRWLNRPEPALDEVRRSLELLVGEAKRASDIIARARALATKGTTDRAAVHPATLIEEAAALVARQVTSLGAVLEIDIAARLPAVRADRIQLQQVLVNLIINAAQAMSDQTRAPEIRVTAFREPDGVGFAVEDNGPGIPADRLDQLFNAFYTTKATGMGIGLSVSKTIVEAHGGRIAAGSSLAGGARFMFHIPCDENP